MTTTDPWVAWLESNLGVTEYPRGSNRTRYGIEFGWNGQPWCAIFQSVATLHAFGSRVLWTAGVDDARSQAMARVNGMLWLPRNATVRVGDVSCFDWRGYDNPNDMHMSGIVNPATQTKFETIGGNESDRVMRQWRDRSAVMGFIRLPFDEIGLAPVIPLTQEDIDNMGKIQLVTCHESEYGNTVFKVLDNFFRWPIPGNTPPAVLAEWMELWGGVSDIPKVNLDALVPLDVISQRP